MKLFTADQIRKADQYTIKHEPVASIALMERAAAQCFRYITRNFNREHAVYIFVGPGNNGGDGLALARMLADDGYYVYAGILNFTDHFSEDFQVNFDRLKNEGRVKWHYINEVSQIPDTSEKSILIDSVFGSGLTRPLKGLPGEVIEELNKREAVKIAVDIPSGLFAEENIHNDENVIFQADYTLTFQFPKLSFFMPENDCFVGKWEVMDIHLHQDFIQKESSAFHLLQKSEIAPMLRSRSKFSHKGTYGHGMMIAGSYGMMGASVLSVKSCVKTGIGLVTAHIPRTGVDIIQISAPEALVSIDESDIIFTGCNHLEKYNAIAIGPGLGAKTNTVKGLKDLIDKVEVPLIIDADGLNILSDHPEWLKFLPHHTVLTPHPREFERLFGKCNTGVERVNRAIEKAKEFDVIIVLKGAYTTIATPEGKVYFNSTGNPGMATGGTGDVLTGVILSLRSQGYEAAEACCLGVFLHGLAGDLAAQEKSIYALAAGDVVHFIGKAYTELIEYLR
jgi:NAD(P)H-hydrate epimerase